MFDFFNTFDFLFYCPELKTLLFVFSLEFLICIKKKKRVSEERLFTVITSGLLAAFYSLCTEIKVCIWQTPCLLVLLFFLFISCDCSYPFEI